MTLLEQNGGRTFGPEEEAIPKLAEWLEINENMLWDLWTEEEPDRETASARFIRRVVDEYTGRVFAVNISHDGTTTIIELLDDSIDAVIDQ